MVDAATVAAAATAVAATAEEEVVVVDAATGAGATDAGTAGTATAAVVVVDAATVAAAATAVAAAAAAAATAATILRRRQQNRRDVSKDCSCIGIDRASEKGRGSRATYRVVAPRGPDGTPGGGNRDLLPVAAGQDPVTTGHRLARFKARARASRSMPNGVLNMANRVA